MIMTEHLQQQSEPYSESSARCVRSRWGTQQKENKNKNMFVLCTISVYGVWHFWEALHKAPDQRFHQQGPQPVSGGDLTW